MNTALFAFGLGMWEIIAILAVVVILFGAKKIPELAKGLGQGIKEFKKASNEATDEIHRAINEPPPRATSSGPQAPERQGLVDSTG
jgi:sec-independent protein translocase protein TatA